MQINEIISVVVSCVGVLATAISVIIGIVKNIKNKDANFNLASVMSIGEKAMEFIADAEKKFATIRKSGVTKKEVVLTKINNLCIELGITYDETYWSEKVDAYLELTKSVNK